MEQGRNFCNKIWNAFRLVKGWTVADVPQSEACAVAVDWFRAKLAQTAAQMHRDYENFRINDAVMGAYKCFWDDFCSWYLEIVKPVFVDGVQQPLDKATYAATLEFFDALLKMLHPVMPFITEELWHALEERGEGETVMFQPIPTGGSFDARLVDDFAAAGEVVVAVRALRQARNIGPREPLKLQVKGSFPVSMEPVVRKMACVSEVEHVEAFSGNGEVFMVGTTEFSVPLDGMIDVEAEIAKIEAEIQRYEGFLRGVNAKLSNEKFVANAPAKVVETERKKLADATTKIENLKARLATLKK